MVEDDLDMRVARLKEKGVPWTIQRYAVLEYLYKNRTHPTAEELYQGLRAQLPTISRATVYNALKLLKRHGLVLEVTIEKDRARYDYRVDPHPHFLCRLCHTVYDLGIECPYPLKSGDMVEGHRVEEVRPYVIGVCRRCLKGGEDA